MIPLTNPDKKSIKYIVDTNQHKCCEQCGKEEINVKGLCKSCYKKQYNKKYPEKQREMHKKWKLDNPERAKESQRKCRLRYWEKYPEKKKYH